MDKNMRDKMEKLMRKHSVPDSFKCSKCRDLGYVFEEDEQGCEYAVPCECLGKKIAQENLDKCGLSEIFKTKNFNNYLCQYKSQSIAKMRAINYCDNNFDKNQSILICGKSGSGKTHLGIAIMLCLIDKGAVCKYVEYNNMIVELKQSVMDEENHMRAMEKLTNPQVIFIDDFLKGHTTEVDLNYVYRIINTRYLKNKPMIISTEKSVEEIMKWDEAVGSRLVQMAGENVIVFDKNSQNFRLRNYKK